MSDRKPAMPTCSEPTIRPFQHPKQSRTLLQSRRLAGPNMAPALPQHSHSSDNSEALNPVFRFLQTQGGYAVEAPLSSSSKRKRLWEREGEKVTFSAAGGASPLRGAEETDRAEKDESAERRLSSTGTREDLGDAGGHALLSCCGNISTDHTPPPPICETFHRVHLYVQHPSLSQHTWLRVFACERHERGIETEAACIYVLERDEGDPELVVW